MAACNTLLTTLCFELNVHSGVSESVKVKVAQLCDSLQPHGLYKEFSMEVMECSRPE